MKKIPATYFVLLLVIIMPAWTMAQVDSTDIDSIAIDRSILDTVTVLTPAQIERSQKAGETFTVTPWEFHAPLGADVAATDSSLRWQNWPDWTYKLNRKPGVISYRMGTSLRGNAVQYYAHEPRHQQLYWEGISLNDPVSGALQWSLIPQHKIGDFYTRDLGTEFRSTYYLRQYYLTKPLSRLIYSESKFNYRNLAFEISHNLSRRTNVEVSYWDRRSGGEYPNSTVNGRQIFAKISHHLGQDRYLKLNFINTSFDIGRPFGYVMSDLRLFNFDRFSAVPNASSGLSKESSNILALNYYQRSPDSTVATDNFHAGIYYKGSERSLEYQADSTRYNVQSVGATATKWWNTGGLSLEGRVNAEQFFNQTTKAGSLPVSNWALFETEGKATFDTLPIINLLAEANFKQRSDGFRSSRLNLGADISVGPVTLSPGISSGSVMPTPQQLYWNSDNYNGNSRLANEKIREARGSLQFAVNSDITVGLRGQHKDIADGIMVVDSSFTNVSHYASQSAAAFVETDFSHFEFNGSATVHRFTDSFAGTGSSIPMTRDKRIWLKGSAYWKGYLFDRATYVKAGLSGMVSPLRYQADHYIPELGYWQSVSSDQRLPIFNRLDIDISARVRSIMFVLRFENVLDDVNQLGYFETAQYPMSQRRFIFGVRALFRN